jgi:hypothetical protein
MRARLKKASAHSGEFSRLVHVTASVGPRVDTFLFDAVIQLSIGRECFPHALPMERTVWGLRA